MSSQRYWEPDVNTSMNASQYPSSFLFDVGSPHHQNASQTPGFLSDSPIPTLFNPRDLLPEDLPTSIKCVFIVFYTVIMLLSVFGNLFVIIVIAVNVKMRTVTNTFLVSLAVSDLLIAALNMPLQLKYYVQNEWSLGSEMCKFTKYMQGVTIVASILTLSGIAIDR